MSKKLLTMDEQKESNEYLVSKINAYWSDLGVEANARVEKRLVLVKFPDEIKAHKIWSYEIVSAISEFVDIELKYGGGRFG